jgi:predicted transcriptional regulator
MMKLSLQEDFSNTADILWALSSEIRLKILQIISGDKEYRLKDLLPYIDCGMSNLSQQLKILEDAGLITKERIKDGSTSKLIRPVFDEIKIEL